MHRMNRKPAQAVLPVVFAVALAALACGGGLPSSTRVPVTPGPTRAGSTQAGPTQTGGAGATASATRPAASVTPRPPLSGSLDVTGVATHLDNKNVFVVIGLVANGTQNPVSGIQLSVSVTDSTGHPVIDSHNGTGKMLTDTVDLMTDFLASGESSAFEYALPTAGQDSSGWKAKAEVASTTNATDLKRVPVEVANQQLTVSADGTTYLSGVLVNKSSTPTQIRGFAGAVLGVSGTVLAADRASFYVDVLAPSGDAAGADRTPFIINLGGPIQAGGTPDFFVDSREAKPSDLQAAAGASLRVENFFVDADKRPHLVVTVSNNGSQTIDPSLVAGLYDQAGNVVAASAEGSGLRPAPGASIPMAFNNFDSTSGNVELFNTVVSYTVQIDPRSTSIFTSTELFVTLQASNVKVDTSGGGVTLTGNVVNTSAQSVFGVYVIIAVHDANGKLIASDNTLAGDNNLVAPKGKVTWTLQTQLPANVDPGTLKYDTIVQAQVQP